MIYYGIKNAAGNSFHKYFDVKTLTKSMYSFNSHYLNYTIPKTPCMGDVDWSFTEKNYNLCCDFVKTLSLSLSNIGVWFCISVTFSVKGYTIKVGTMKCLAKLIVN